MSSPSITKHGPIITAGPLTKLSLSIPDYPRPDGTSAVTLRPFHDDMTTPLVTQTPTMPPALNPQVHTNTPAEYRFPPSSPPQLDQRRHSGPNKRHSNRSSSQSLDMNVFMANRNDSFDHSTVQPPPAPPFAPGMKGSPLSTPPRLTSPLKLHGISPETPRSLTDALARVSMTTNEDYNDSMLSNTPQSLFTTYKEMIPEELQESNSLDAYPNGPRSVLNNRIFLYSDPLTSKKQIDINEYNLVINVAKECKDMSANYLNPIPGKREYLYLPWLHTSQISKDLAPIMTKIDAFYNMGYKILIHCQCGVSRSACVVVAYYMMKFTLGVNDAYELLKNGTNGNREVCMSVRNGGNIIDGSDRICPNMSLIFELMEFGDSLCHKEVTTSALLFDSPSTMQI
ncbi:uncharacterized protein SPAPADRAFT_61447 [Spathaspora passalidarum NRRL Y-27907]|uniref:protein-tyrosine-phosphatase n=1 Tax=Spathaspora passalidarum (strain NRRL Y-27907 / 11-Y1) TaxID=619300 RepID=G3AMV2_SPAPN|nr:uncharacterized protein SPAPADRAFT_61447 [Spathaspora passalidarum NRRL Y-27907]EGW32366.1 hypothetical protein SPAPADRAFT_61447 [Spathaspora passalidarum NRRL Y-27907]